MRVYENVLFRRGSDFPSRMLIALWIKYKKQKTEMIRDWILFIMCILTSICSRATLRGKNN